jgi:hypothetical protein
MKKSPHWKDTILRKGLQNLSEKLHTTNPLHAQPKNNIQSSASTSKLKSSPKPSKHSQNAQKIPETLLKRKKKSDTYTNSPNYDSIKKPRIMTPNLCKSIQKPLHMILTSSPNQSVPFSTQKYSEKTKYIPRNGRSESNTYQQRLEKYSVSPEKNQDLAKVAVAEQPSGMDSKFDANLNLL